MIYHNSTDPGSYTDVCEKTSRSDEKRDRDLLGADKRAQLLEAIPIVNATFIWKLLAPMERLMTESLET